MSLRRDQQGFTEKQRLFLAYYLGKKQHPAVERAMYCATRAAIAAGYSKRTAYSIGSELLKKPHISAVIEEEWDRDQRRRLAREKAQTKIMIEIMFA